MEKRRVGIVGATGLVGQRLIERLQGHPWFDTVAVAASERSAGRPYRDATTWRLSQDPPEAVAHMDVRPCVASAFGDCDLVLSGLDTQAAHEVEPAFAAAGIPVVSNSSAFRMAADVPLLVPEVNAAHLALLDIQRRRTGGGYIVTNPNCSVTGLVLAIAPLHRAFGVERLFVSTMQALSGAGVEGPRALDVIDNVIPYIDGEEEKLEEELPKLLGTFSGGAIVRAPVAVSAHCNRVATLDGHLEAVSVALTRRASPEEAAQVLASFRGDVADLGLPSSPHRPVLVRGEQDRPQPRLDRDAGSGMSAVVGRIRACPVATLRFVLLSHNTVRGAAGATLLNAELLHARGLVVRRGGA